MTGQNSWIPWFALVPIYTACATTPALDDSTTADFFTPTEELMIAAVVDSVAAVLQTDTPICLLVDNRDDWPTAPSLGLLNGLAATSVVTWSECPETYQTMVQPIDSLGNPVDRTAPPGHVDPIHLRVFQLQDAPDDALSVTVNQSQGTVGRTHACTTRLVDGRGVATCRVVSHWIS